MSNKGRHTQSERFCNLDYLMVTLGRNEATAMRLVAMFLENYPLLCQRMYAALEADDAVALRNALHDIRSGCVLFSGQRCVDLARGFEDSLRRHLDHGHTLGSREDWRTMVDTLANCLHCMASEMRSFLAGDAGEDHPPGP
ncbi:MAG: Hpt domain-containing protein [Azonexus sp.]